MFTKEPPPADDPLVMRDDVVVTPHLGASTTEAQVSYRTHGVTAWHMPASSLKDRGRVFLDPCSIDCTVLASERLLGVLVS